MGGRLMKRIRNCFLCKLMSMTNLKHVLTFIVMENVMQATRPVATGRMLEAPDFLFKLKKHQRLPLKTQGLLDATFPR